MSQQIEKAEFEVITETEIEAEEHIDEIARNRRAEAENSAAETYQNQEPNAENLARYLFYLVQHANDGRYQSTSVPSLSISVRLGGKEKDEKASIRLDTNQVPLTKTEVEALCEKGTRFSAVFKIAGSVWVRSGKYSFKLHYDQPTGSIIPIWVKFPEKTTLPDRKTSILVQLRSRTDVGRLVEEIRRVDAPILLFFQRIRRLEIAISSLWKQSWELNEETLLGTHPSLLPLHSPSRIVNVQHTYGSSRYAVFRHPVPYLSFDSRRPYPNQTHIILAFPQSRPRTQKVYGFLPIRDYGFKFLIHADFIPTAAGYGIDPMCEWNQTLLEQIRPAMLSAIDQLCRTPEWDTLWLSYLPVNDSQKTVFQGTLTNVVHMLGSRKVLEAADGYLRRPCDLTRVPPHLIDVNGDPIIPGDFSKHVYLSPKYMAADLRILHGLGVRTLSDDEFLDDLSNFISARPSVFRTMSRDWHFQLCRVLYTLWPCHRDRIARLEVARPINGWNTCPDEAHQLILPLSLESPGAAPISALELTQDRLGLMSPFRIPAKEDSRSICSLIFQAHASRLNPPTNMSVADLVSHAKFLHYSGWKSSQDQPGGNIWFAAEDGSYHHGSTLYLPSNAPYSASHLFSQSHHKRKARFLHRTYRQAFAHFKGWEDWFQENFEMAQLPRLVKTSTTGRNMILTDDFRFLVDHTSLNTILEFLRHHFDYYSPWLVASSRASQIRSYLRLKLARCRNGTLAPLSETYLPRREVLEGFSILEAGLSPGDHQQRAALGIDDRPLLDLPDPDDEGWDFLERIGVSIKLLPMQFITRLEQHRLEPESITKDLVKSIYQHIETWMSKYDLELRCCRLSFQNSRLIFISAASMPPGSKAETEWYKLDECVWEGPTWLIKTPRLNEHYPQHRKLFVEQLAIKENADLDTLIAEARRLNTSESLEYIHKLLGALNSMLQSATDTDRNTAWTELGKLRIWPVKSRSKEPPTEGADLDLDPYDTLVDSQEEWFIADDPAL